MTTSRERRFKRRICQRHGHIISHPIERDGRLIYYCERCDHTESFRIDQLFSTTRQRKKET
jgi:hypothetical protein